MKPKAMIMYIWEQKIYIDKICIKYVVFLDHAIIYEMAFRIDANSDKQHFLSKNLKL